jgi:beta-glucuronidase
MDNWRSKYPDKPVMITEYGADTISGFHTLPSFVWTEDYQTDLMENNFHGFDILRRNKTGFVGEMIWNFADFMTRQTPGRALGNKKGIFTRQRQPKASAHVLRKRYRNLAQEIDKFMFCTAS